MLLARRPRRRGLSLLEVLTALAIFLFSLIVISQLVGLAGDRALAVQQQGDAAQKCQSKLAEVVIGAVPLASQPDQPLDDDPDWMWSMTAEPADVANLWSVNVRVYRQQSDGTQVECSFSRLVFDPAARGSTMDNVTIAGTESTGATGTGTTGQQPAPATTPQPAAQPAAPQPAAPQPSAPAAPSGGTARPPSSPAPSSSSPSPAPSGGGTGAPSQGGDRPPSNTKGGN